MKNYNGSTCCGDSSTKPGQDGLGQFPLWLSTEQHSDTEGVPQNRVCPKGKLRQGCWEGELLSAGQENTAHRSGKHCSVLLSPCSLPCLSAVPLLLLSPRLGDRAAGGCTGSLAAEADPCSPSQGILQSSSSLSAMLWVYAGAWPRYRNGIYGIKWNSIWDKKWGGLYSRVVLNWGLMYVQYTNIFDRPLTPIIL